MPFRDPERKRAYQKGWVARNVERHRRQTRAGVKKWRQRHPDQHRAYRREHYALNAERLRTQIALWHSAHPEVHRAARRRRRAREAGAEGGFTVLEWQRLVERYDGRCGYCGVPGPLEPDHRVPLMRGGSDLIANIIPACGPCNRRKGTLTESEFRDRLRREKHRDRSKTR